MLAGATEDLRHLCVLASQLPASLQCPSSGFNSSLNRLLKCKEYNVPRIFFYARETSYCCHQPTRSDWIGVPLSSFGLHKSTSKCLLLLRDI
ncbi:hypothetical protein V5799_003034 [Amblyomma americanum]|uniref:Uncharacterized protein n=1 Tax=Amblyomma americanum TaxID=6943 RepID=A0AAQ4DA47_AMBAM